MTTCPQCGSPVCKQGIESEPVSLGVVHGLATRIVGLENRLDALESADRDTDEALMNEMARRIVALEARANSPRPNEVLYGPPYTPPAVIPVHPRRAPEPKEQPSELERWKAWGEEACEKIRSFAEHDHSRTSLACDIATTNALRDLLARYPGAKS